MKSTKASVLSGFNMHHDVETLGRGVADAVAGLIATYADRVALAQVPPITLQGPGWDAPWEKLREVDGCSGNSGPSDEEIRVGVEWYTCLVVALPQPNRRPPSLEEICPRTVEGVIAHEVTHLRWRTLRHGPEFYARSLGLLRGATFPSRGGWSKSTHDTMNATREQVRGWFTRLDHSQEGIQAD